ncbi:unnamed protein product [Rhizophagus irregularis]|nr:unnamed protein product [Rhizophagus irregularis]
MASSSIEDNIIKSPTDDNNSTPVVNTSVAFADPSGSSSSNTTSKDEPIYKDGKLHSSLSHNEKKTLRPLQDKRQHSPIASSSLPPTKGKKKQKGRATDPDFNIKQLQILEETMDESGLHLALTVRHNKLYEPEYITHQAPRQLKRSATRNFNLDLHYNLHMRKRFHHFTEDSALVTNFCSN